MGTTFIESIVRIVLIVGAISLAAKIINKEKGKATPNQVHLPRLYLWVGLIGTVFFFGALLFLLFSDETEALKWMAGIIFGFFGAMSAVYIVLYFNVRINYGDTGFTYKTFFAKTVAFSYDEIIRIKKTGSSIILYTNNRKLRVDRMAIGASEFLSKLPADGNSLQRESLPARE